MNYPFRVGTTSYIIPAGLVENVRYLGGKVQDIELVLFDVEDGPSNLPTPEQIKELKCIAEDQDLTFTVHLPLDLRMDDKGSASHISLDQARRVIEITRDLAPWAYVAHLDGRAVLPFGTSLRVVQVWQDQAVQVLGLVGQWVGDLHKISLENLEGYPLDFYSQVLDRIAVSRTVDIGHLWLDGHEPLSYLRTALPRTRVVHIHGIIPVLGWDGISKRDHSSLNHIDPSVIRSLLNELILFNYSGVVTIELFSEQDFLSSLQSLEMICL